MHLYIEKRPFPLYCTDALALNVFLPDCNCVPNCLRLYMRLHAFVRASGRVCVYVCVLGNGGIPLSEHFGCKSCCLLAIVMHVVG